MSCNTPGVLLAAVAAGPRARVPPRSRGRRLHWETLTNDAGFQPFAMFFRRRSKVLLQLESNSTK